MLALVIDDAPEVCEILSYTLMRLGFEVRVAGDGCEALDYLRALGGADVALVDWAMPRMNGVEFVRAVRGDPALAPTRLIMVTAKNDLDQVAQALAAGADEYVMKPFTPEIIRDKIALVGLAAPAYE